MLFYLHGETPYRYVNWFDFAGVTKFDPQTGKQFKTKAATQPYTTYFAEALIAGKIRTSLHTYEKILLYEF